ncbi:MULTISPECIES: ABC-2 transporter permease [unclassified Bacillus (in: firmicutes)]|uniref:ABC-2 transporter permease n=1 Tax=unclassified Bacillus (in: firmicutes) TaxID=185979 RepID=UPI0008E0D467|nr:MULTISPECIES: ABC-2 transporter permease [unclassified Bacillus (in: firmicutes)]SFI48863.1 ABC-2 type transport system permease protein [Bacillus sp. 71mf]SFS49396.1 ABC-2 type transport system permease protein [Bacillus sp. 103mf]
MRQLVFKDLYFLRAMWIFCLGFPAFLFITNPSNSNIFSVSCLISVIVSLLLSVGSDEKNGSEKIIASLPIERKGIIIAKYMTFIISTIIAIVLTTAATWIIRGMTLIEDIRVYHPYFYIELKWYTVLGGIIVSFIYIALFLPVYYGTDSKIIRGLFAIGLIIPTTLIPLFVIDGEENRVEDSFGDWIMNLSHVGVSIVGIAGLAVIYIISMFIAIKLYEKRDV